MSSNLVSVFHTIVVQYTCSWTVCLSSTCLSVLKFGLRPLLYWSTMYNIPVTELCIRSETVYLSSHYVSILKLWVYPRIVYVLKLCTGPSRYSSTIYLSMNCVYVLKLCICLQVGYLSSNHGPILGSYMSSNCVPVLHFIVLQCTCFKTVYFIPVLDLCICPQIVFLSPNLVSDLKLCNTICILYLITRYFCSRSVFLNCVHCLFILELCNYPSFRI